MPEPANAINLATVSKGLTAMKAIWSSATRVAALQEQYGGKAIPADKLFGAMFGFGDKPNPLEFVEKQLAQIDAKLDRVLAGIEELKHGQLGQGVLAAYLDMSDPIYLIEKYFQDLVAYQNGDQPWTEAERKEFVDKLLGTRSERDSVAFSAHKIVKLSPTTQTPLFFDLLFPYLLAVAKAGNAREIYLQGAFAFRSVAETLARGLILELFAVSSTGGDPRRLAARVERVVERYRTWLTAMVENSFLPFAERLATFNFRDEYLGGHDTTYDAHVPRVGWRPANPSLLQSADDLGNKLLGKSASITLRVIPHVPPVADRVNTRRDAGIISPGQDVWEVTRRPETALTRETMFDKLWHRPEAGKHFFLLNVGSATGDNMAAQSVRKVGMSFADGAAAPTGFDKQRLNFLRYQFHFDNDDDTQVWFRLDTAAAAVFPDFQTTWRKVYIEEGRKFPTGAERTIAHGMISGPGQKPAGFTLPPEGQLSPVLVTYTYERFEPSPN